MTRERVEILMKSGVVLKLSVEELSVSSRNGKVSKLAWTDAMPRILHIDLDEIAAVTVQE